MRAWRSETSVLQDGVIRVTDVPFKAGESVEVIVIERTAPPRTEAWRSLRESVVRFDNPTEPVAVEDRDALK
jgi:hypothetical protein